VGLYREGDDLYPILLRHEPEERHAAADNMELLQIRTPRAVRTVPLAQVPRDTRLAIVEPFINPWDREHPGQQRVHEPGHGADHHHHALYHGGALQLLAPDDHHRAARFLSPLSE